MPEPNLNPNELELLIEGFLNGELDDAEAARLASRLEADPAAARAFDSALHTEALLRSAHAPGKAVPSNVIKLADQARARRENPFAIPLRMWVGVAAMLLATVGAVAYFKLYPSSTTTETAGKNKKDESNPAFTVASGRVWVDGSEPRSISENEWVNVSPDGPARFKSGGIEMELDAGTGALLRKDGANLLNGSGTFTVKAGAPAFALETRVGTVRMNEGEVNVKLLAESAAAQFEEPRATKKKTGAALVVTVLAGSAQVETAAKTFPRLMAGMSRTYGGQSESEIPGPRPAPRPPPPDCGLVAQVLKHSGELALSSDQVKSLEEIRGEVMLRRAAFEKDEKLHGLHDTLDAAMDSQNFEAAREARMALRNRENEILKGFAPGRNPMEVLSAEQRQQMHGMMEQFGPPQHRGPQDGQRHPDEEGPPPDGPRPPRSPFNNADGPPPDGNHPRNGERPPPPPDGQRRPQFNDGGPRGGREPNRPPPPEWPKDTRPGETELQSLNYLQEHADEFNLTGEQKAKLKNAIEKKSAPK